MKWTAILLLFLLLFTGCKKGITFILPYSATVTIPSTVGVDVPVSFPTPDIPTNSQVAFENNDTRSEWITSIGINSLEAEITAPVGEDFNFLESIHIYISADGLDELELAYLDPVPDLSVSTLTLTTTEHDFAEHIKQENFSIRTEVVVDEVSFFEREIEIGMIFNVSAKAPFL